jgi:hypothetical protein
VIQLSITLDIDRAPWSDIETTATANAEHGDDMGLIERVGLLRHGTAGGRATLSILVRLPDGTPVLAQTTLRNAVMAARIFAASPVFAEEDFS